MGRASLIALVALMLAACGGGGTSTFTNPVWNQDFPDPNVVRVGDTYYAYATNGHGKQVQTLTSPDLVHWTPGADALPKLGAWAYPGSTWAPEVLAVDGRYVLYYTANGGGQCVGRAVAEEPGGPFVDRWQEPLVCQKIDGGSIDASPFRDDDGALYLYWKNDGNSLGKPTNIWVQKLSADGTELVGTPAKVGETNDQVWEANVVEAPEMVKHDGAYVLFYSGGNYADDTYGVGYATCDGPTGPCTDAPENPILKTRCRAHGPGHNSFAGDWVVYHAWLPDHAGNKRVLWIDRLEWQGGKPVVHGPTCTKQSAP